MFDSLPPPAKYFPFEKGTYDVLPGLRPFGEDFGNGVADACIFQLDSHFCHFRTAMLEARRDHFARHVLSERYSEQAAADVARFIIQRLVAEHPQWFAFEQDGSIQRLTCSLTNEVLCFSRDWRLVDEGTRSDVEPRYSSALDALACQVQEDLAITCANESGNWIAALHVCLPSHWIPADKLERDFGEVHAPVPGMEPFSRNQAKFVNKMLGATTGLVRFVWGLQWNDTLNRHPARCTTTERFDPEAENAFLRVERQTIWGLPDSRASLFTIRPYLIDVRELKRDDQLVAALIAAIESMSDQSLRYKGLTENHEEFLRWLRRPSR